METLACRWVPSCCRRCRPKQTNAFRLSSLPREKNDSFWRHAQHLGCKISGGVLMGMLFVNQPALADNIQTVPAADVTQLAQPLQKQEIKKGEIWLVFVVGAASLFGATLVLENNESLFPAISKANKAMKISSQQAKKAEAEQLAGGVPMETDPTPSPSSSPSITAEESEAQLLSAVESGLAQARTSFADANKSESRPESPKPPLEGRDIKSDTSVEEMGKGSTKEKSETFAEGKRENSTESKRETSAEGKGENSTEEKNETSTKEPVMNSEEDRKSREEDAVKSKEAKSEKLPEGVDSEDGKKVSQSSDRSKAESASEKKPETLV